MFLRKCIMPLMKMEFSSLMCIRPTRQTKFFQAILIMKMQKISPCYGIPMRMRRPHSIVHELTFFVKEADGSFSRHDEVHEERTYEVLTYDILLEQAGFKSFKLFADFEDKEPTETSTRWFFVAQK